MRDREKEEEGHHLRGVGDRGRRKVILPLVHFHGHRHGVLFGFLRRLRLRLCLRLCGTTRDFLWPGH